jgi:hypothetical protein
MKELVQGITNSPTTSQDQRNLELAGRVAIRMPKRRGSNQRSEVRGQRSEILLWERLSAAILALNDFNDFYAFYGFYDLPFTVYRLPFDDLTN